MSMSREEFKLFFKRDIILDKVISHRERYQKTYELLKDAYAIAYEEYRKNHAKWTDRFLKNKLAKGEEEPEKPHLAQNRTKTYDMYIAMLENTIQDEFDLNVKLFNNLYMDNWDFVREHIRALTVWADSFESGALAAFSTTTTSTTSTTIGDRFVDALADYDVGE